MRVDVRDVRFVRGDRQILDIPALSIRSGRVTAVLGPNGSGKSTLLRLIAGLDHPASGAVRIGDHGVADIAYAFQEPVMFRQTVRWNLELGLRFRGMDRGRRLGLVEDAARWLGVSHLLDRRATDLSGGEMRRVALARALALRAPLLLLDEPFAGLDHRTRAQLLAELLAALTHVATTTILVSHDRDEALRLADDLVLLVEGSIVAAAPVTELLANPRSAVAAALLGYSVLESAGQFVAVKPASLQVGAGVLTFVATVEHVREWVGMREASVRIGDDRMSVALPATANVPAPGDQLAVHAPPGCWMTLDERR